MTAAIWFWIVLWVVGSFASLALFLLVIWVAFHFIQRFW